MFIVTIIRLHANVEFIVLHADDILDACKSQHAKCITSDCAIREDSHENEMHATSVQCAKSQRADDQ